MTYKPQISNRGSATTDGHGKYMRLAHASIGCGVVRIVSPCRSIPDKIHARICGVFGHIVIGTSNDQPYFNGANGFPFTAAGHVRSCLVGQIVGPSVYAVEKIQLLDVRG